MTAPLDAKAEFLDQAVWHGTLDRSAAILAEHPEIAGSDIYTTAILGDDEGVRRFLAADPANATAKGGPRGWDALTYLCFSKYLRLDPSRSDGFVRAATALLDAGASANTGFDSPDHQPHPTLESVLYGAAGVAHHPEMTRLLLDRGADPNDGEVAYHTPETLDNRAMKVLVESGKLTSESMMWLLARKINWHDDEGFAWLLEHGVDPNSVLLQNRPLHFALNHGTPFSYFELLLDRGAEPRLTGKGDLSAIALAARLGRADVLDLFERRGFPIQLTGDSAFLAACTRADALAARRVMAEDPTLVERLQTENDGLLVQFAGADNPSALRLMLDLGFDAGAARREPKWMRGETALHVAAGQGFLANARVLIERGAPLDAKNNRGNTPLGVAILCLEQQSEWTPNDATLPIAASLIEAGANVQMVNMTLAAAVCLDRNDDIARLAPEASIRDRQVALAAAAYNGLAATIPSLIQLGADPNATNQGLHPYAMALHNAVASGSLDTVRALVEAGAKVDIRDTVYQATPLSWAEYFVREKRNANKQDVTIAAYLRELEKPNDPNGD